MEKFKLFCKKYITVRSVLLVLFAGIFLFSSIYLGIYFINSRKGKNQYNELANIVNQEGTRQVLTGDMEFDDYMEGDEEEKAPEVVEGDGDGKYVNVTHAVTGKPMAVLKEYAPIYQMNSDTVGWIRIDGTRINYPVMQTPDQINYYLKRDFYKQDARYGSIYAHETASMDPVSDNVTIYGHNMADGTMFAALHKYRDEGFFREHPYITFDTLTTHQTYKIIAVFETTDFIDNGFAYHYFVDGDQDEFEKFVATCKELALYETGETAVYGNKLLTLSTCDNDIVDSHGRFVVVAKKVAR